MTRLTEKSTEIYYQSLPPEIKQLYKHNQLPFSKISKFTFCKLIEYVTNDKPLFIIREICKKNDRSNTTPYYQELMRLSETKALNGQEVVILNTNASEKVREIIRNAIVKRKMIQSGNWEFVTEDGTDKKIFKLTKDTQYSDIDIFLSQDYENNVFKYDPDILPLSKTVNQNSPALQHVRVKVMSESEPIKINTINYYKCQKCGKEHWRAAHEMRSSPNEKLGCNNYITEKKMCNTLMLPQDELCQKKSVYYLEIMATDSHKKAYINFDSYSLHDIPPGEYDIYCYVINSKSKNQLYVISYKELVSTAAANTKFDMKENNYNVVQQIRQSMDDFIYQQMGFELVNNRFMKELYIIAFATKYIQNYHSMNVAMIGSKDTSKSFTIKMYSPMLTRRCMIAVSNSISIPAMRGSTKRIIIQGRERFIKTVGYFGEYDGLVIEEMFDEDDMVKSLKGFLLESHYNNSKVNGDPVDRFKRATVVTNANIDTRHINYYRKRIKEELKRLYDRDFEYKMKTGEKVHKADYVLPASINLFLPLDGYNKILGEAISNVRDSYYENQFSWMNGIDLPSLDRFPLQYNILRQGMSMTKDELIGNLHNIASEDNEINPAIVLNTDAFVDYFETCKEYCTWTEKDSEMIYPLFKKMIEDFGFEASGSRTSKLLVKFMKTVKALNKHKELTKKDVYYAEQHFKLFNRIVNPDEIDYCDGTFWMGFESWCEEMYDKKKVKQAALVEPVEKTTEEIKRVEFTTSTLSKILSDNPKGIDIINVFKYFVEKDEEIVDKAIEKLKTAGIIHEYQPGFIKILR